MKELTVIELKYNNNMKNILIAIVIVVILNGYLQYRMDCVAKEFRIDNFNSDLQKEMERYEQE